MEREDGEEGGEREGSRRGGASRCVWPKSGFLTLNKKHHEHRKHNCINANHGFLVKPLCLTASNCHARDRTTPWHPITTQYHTFFSG